MIVMIQIADTFRMAVRGISQKWIGSKCKGTLYWRATTFTGIPIFRLGQDLDFPITDPSGSLDFTFNPSSIPTNLESIGSYALYNGTFVGDIVIRLE